MTTAEPQPTEEPVEVPTAQAPPDQAPPGRRGGRAPTDLAASAVAAVAAVLLLVGAAVMRVPEASGFLGPRFFPLVVGTLLLATAIGSAGWALLGKGARNRAEQAPEPERPTADDTGGEAAAHETGEQAAAHGTGDTAPAAPRSDWRTLATMGATLAAHVALLEPLGWLIAGTLLFWGISYALDRRRPLLDLCVAAALSGVVQLVFSGLLDVALPAGLLGKVL